MKILYVTQIKFNVIKINNIIMKNVTYGDHNNSNFAK